MTDSGLTAPPRVFPRHTVGDRLATHPAGATAVVYSAEGELWTMYYVAGDFVRPHPEGGWGVHDRDGIVRSLTRAELTQLEQILPGDDWPPIHPTQQSLFAARSGPVECFDRSELGNARRLIHSHGSDLRYVPEWGIWLAWDGRRWAPDITGEAERRAKAVADDLMTEATATKDEKQFRWAIRSQSAAGIRNMLALAATEPGVPLTVDELDADPWAFNCVNGTIDLRTGELRTHRRADLITKLAPVDYDPDGTCPTWLKFLADVFDGNQEVIGFVRRFIGYTLTAHVREHKLVFCHGAGANGKSTLLETLRALLGDYGLVMDPQIITMAAHEQHPTGLTDLRGARFVATVETEQGRRFNEALLKQLTGGDSIRARRMHRDFFEFQPTHKLWIAGNHLPKITGTDAGIWRRLALLPFNVSFAGTAADRTMGEKLLAEAPGILLWAVQGCAEWQEKGLDEPEIVTAATGQYRAEQDHLGRFLDECCVTAEAAYVATKDLRTAYEAWCHEQGEKPWSATAVGRELTARGFDSARSSRDRKWLGIGLAADAAEAA